MYKKFKVTVNNNFVFDLTPETISKLDIQSISNSSFHILHEDKSYTAEIDKHDFNKKSYQVKINSNIYNISIANQLDTLIETMGFHINQTKHIDLVTAPMPGLIIDINVEEGMEVKENDALMILEAMKMENTITSPRNGIIKSISVKQGDAVEKNRLLIEFEK